MIALSKNENNIILNNVRKKKVEDKTKGGSKF